MAPKLLSDVSDLQNHVNLSLVKGLNGSFLPSSKLDSYYSKAWRLSRLLRALDLSDALRSQIYTNFQRVFTILVLIGRAQSIREFISHGHLADRSLPFRSCDDWPEDCRDFFESFTSLQWQFCPLRFKYGDLLDRRLHDKEILPIIEEASLNKGGNSRTSLVWIHPEYDDLQDHRSKGRETTKYLLKTICSPKDEQSYLNELDTYTRLMQADDQGNKHKEDDVVKHLIKLYGSWRQKGQCNLLLEYADHGTLQEWFEKTTPPHTKKEFITFWSNLVHIVKPIQCLHEGLRDPTTGGTLHAIHQDLTLSNILVSSNGGSSAFDVTFKLSDFGLTRFEERSDAKKDIEARERCGTQMYSAPECTRDDPFLQRTQLWVKNGIDVWSLGCILSEVVVWSSYGNDGLIKYLEDRRHETAHYPNLEAAGYSGCFHDGENVLKAVDSTLKEIRKTHRTSDPIVDSMIMLVGDLLAGVEELASRPNLVQVYKRCKKMVDNASKPQAPHDSAQSPDRLLFSPPRYPSIFEDDEKENAVAAPAPQYPLTDLRNMQKPTDGLGIRLSSPPTPKATASHHSRIHDFGDSALRGWTEHNRSPQPYIAGQGQSPASVVHDPGVGSSRPTHQPSRSSSSIGSPRLREATKTQPTMQSSKSIEKAVINGTPKSNQHSRGKSRKLSIPEAEQHIKNVKHSILRNGKTKALPSFEEYTENLEGRDAIFLIDSSASMQKHWRSVIRVFSVLTHFTKRADPDGHELYFTTRKRNFRGKDRDSMIRTLDKMTPKGRCKMTYSLRKVLDTWYFDYDKSRSALRRTISKVLRRKTKEGVTVYVFTDGEWQDEQKPVRGVATSIKTVVDKLVEKGENPEHFIGVQFIHFGDYDSLRQMTSKLLAELEQLGVARNLVDVEPSSGNVWKMLLASHDPYCDFDGD